MIAVSFLIISKFFLSDLAKFKLRYLENHAEASNKFILFTFFYHSPEFPVQAVGGN